MLIYPAGDVQLEERLRKMRGFKRFGEFGAVVCVFRAQFESRARIDYQPSPISTDGAIYIPVDTQEEAEETMEFLKYYTYTSNEKPYAPFDHVYFVPVGPE